MMLSWILQRNTGGLNFQCWENSMCSWNVSACGRYKIITWFYSVNRMASYGYIFAIGKALKSYSEKYTLSCSLPCFHLNFYL